MRRRRPVCQLAIHHRTSHRSGRAGDHRRRQHDRAGPVPPHPYLRRRYRKRRRSGHCDQRPSPWTPLRRRARPPARCRPTSTALATLSRPPRSVVVTRQGRRRLRRYCPSTRPTPTVLGLEPGQFRPPIGHRDPHRDRRVQSLHECCSRRARDRPSRVSRRCHRLSWSSCRRAVRCRDRPFDGHRSQRQRRCYLRRAALPLAECRGPSLRFCRPADRIPSSTGWDRPRRQGDRLLHHPASPRERPRRGPPVCRLQQSRPLALVPAALKPVPLTFRCLPAIGPAGHPCQRARLISARTARRHCLPSRARLLRLRIRSASMAQLADRRRRRRLAMQPSSWPRRPWVWRRRA